ncbi:Cell wall-associated NlpC family hydrolase OS=Ureibacillus acetophenoni OX=614649 GN=SAMN05877842_11427 PE=3 SV=1 [Ureibacillus acetophenoni]
MKKRWLLPILSSFLIMSAMPGENAEAASTTDVITTAKQYINVPYLYGGTTIKGIDCSAFTQKVFAELGIDLSRTSGGQYNQGTAVSKSNLQIGDLVFFNTSGRGVSHVGIYIGNGNMISAETTEGVTISSINDPYYWGKRYIGAKRVAKFDTPEAIAAVAKKAAEVKAAEVDFSIYASRGEVAKRLAEANGLDTTPRETGFDDVPASHPYSGYIAAVKEEGYFSGDANNKFNPNSPITRSQLSLVLVNVFGIAPGEIEKTFTDVNAEKFPKNAEAIDIMASNKITIGYPDGRFGVADYVSFTHLDVFLKNINELKK